MTAKETTAVTVSCSPNRLSAGTREINQSKTRRKWKYNGKILAVYKRNDEHFSGAAVAFTRNPLEDIGCNLLDVMFSVKFLCSWLYNGNIGGHGLN